MSKTHVTREYGIVVDGILVDVFPTKLSAVAFAWRRGFRGYAVIPVTSTVNFITRQV